MYFYIKLGKTKIEICRVQNMHYLHEILHRFIISYLGEAQMPNFWVPVIFDGAAIGPPC